MDKSISDELKTYLKVLLNEIIKNFKNKINKNKNSSSLELTLKLLLETEVKPFENVFCFIQQVTMNLD